MKEAAKGVTLKWKIIKLHSFYTSRFVKYY
jgi:hypothetical protein